MSLFEPVSQPKIAPTAPLKTARSAAPPSLWLYLAGLCVTLSGLYAVWSDVDSGVYRAATFLLAAAGCGFSFLARRLRFPTRTLRAMALAGIAAFFAFALTTRHGLDALLPADALNDRSKACLILIAWGATLLTFLLNSDAAVLFSCVPSMSMIALVSTLSPDAPMQNVFLVFVGAATFLMVHENYLRTQGGGLPAQTETAQKLLRGQMQLAALCVVGSLTLAMLAVVPIRLVGQTLFLPSAVTAMKNGQNPLHSLASLNGGGDHNDVLDIATGPVAPGDQLIMEIQSEDAHYWRGATFDRYTGSSFVNSEQQATTHLTPTRQTSHFAQSGESMTAQQMESETPPAQFDVDPASALNPLELPDEDMTGSRAVTRQVTLEDNRSRQIYGAGRVKQVWLPEEQLNYNIAGSLTMCAGPPRGRIYTTRARIADDNPTHLQAVSSDRRDIPPAIASHYLQTNLPNPALQEMAAEITRDCANNYDRVMAIQSYISTNCKYNLQASRAPRNRDIVEYFLRESKEGYCDSFAAALTMLCRYAGIPARLATGFCVGDYDSKRHAFIVREKHRHAWTEVFFPKIGWVTFDATSGALDISDYPAKQNRKQMGFWVWLLSSGAAPPAIGLACVGILGLVARNELRGRPKRAARPNARRELRAIRDRRIAASYAAACLALKRRGWERSPAQTPDEYAAWVREKAGSELLEIIPPLQALTGLYAASCYGSRALTEAEAVQAKAAAAQIARTLRRAKRARPAPKTETA